MEGIKLELKTKKEAKVFQILLKNKGSQMMIIKIRLEKRKGKNLMIGTMI